MCYPQHLHDIYSSCIHSMKVSNYISYSRCFLFNNNNDTFCLIVIIIDETKEKPSLNPLNILDCNFAAKIYTTFVVVTDSFFWASNHEHFIFKTLCQLPIMNLKQLYLYLTFALSWISNKPSQAFMLDVARCQEFKSPYLPPSDIFCSNESVIQTVCFLSCSRFHSFLQLNLWANLSSELQYIWT